MITRLSNLSLQVYGFFIANGHSRNEDEEEKEKGDDEEADKRDQGAAFVLFGKLRLFSLTLLTFCTQGNLL